MNTNFDDIEAFVNTTPGVLQLTGGTVTGAVQLNNTLTLGSSGAGEDVILWGDTAGDYFWYDADTNKLVLEGTNGSTALDVTDGNVVIGDGTLTVGSDGAGEDVTFYSDTAGDHFVWDSSAEKLTITGTAAATALDIADGNVTIADDLDVDGTTNLDAVDIDGAVQIDGTVTVGVDDTGYDVKLFGATATTGYMLWDESEDNLIFGDASEINLGTGLDLKIYANGSHSFIDHDGDGELYIRARGTGEDMYIDAKDNLNLQTDSSTRLAINSSGQIAQDGVIGRIAPTGVVLPFAGGSIPAGWLLCTGGAVSRTTYANLFSCIGTTYGVGDGSSTFNVPDMQGRVPAGVNTADSDFVSLNTTGGAATVTLALTDVPAHGHEIYGSTGGGATPYRKVVTSSGNNFTGTTYTVLSGAAEMEQVGGGGSHNNLQPYISLYYIIAT